MPFIGGIAASAAAGVAAGVGATVQPFGPEIPGAGGPGGAGSGRLRVEPDQLDAAIGIFRSALASVEGEVRNARFTLLADPPANDEVSVNAASAFNRVGVQNPNSALAAWEGCVEQLRSIIEQLEAAKQTNVNADTSNSAFLRN